MQLFLYMCEECSTARFSKVNRGDMYYADCIGCRSLMFHRNVLIDTIWCIQHGRILTGENKLGFYIEDDNGSKKERKID